MNEALEAKGRRMAGVYESLATGIPKRLRIPNPVAFFVALVGVLEAQGWKIIPPRC